MSVFVVILRKLLISLLLLLLLYFAFWIGFVLKLVLLSSHVPGATDDDDGADLEKGSCESYVRVQHGRAFFKSEVIKNDNPIVCLC
jgi:hypothetical protein